MAAWQDFVMGGGVYRVVVPEMAAENGPARLRKRLLLNSLFPLKCPVLPG